MKKTILTLVLVGFAFQTYAQDLIFEAKIKKNEVPVVILESVEKDFPDFVVEEYSAVPLEFIEEDVIVDRDIKSNNDYSTFQITLRNKNEKLTATYTKGGKLISTFAHGENVLLPKAVRDAVAKAFPKWIFIEDHYKMVSYNDGKKNERYKVIINKGNEIKKVIVDASGNIISVHKKVKL
jgi:ribosomal protein L21E